LRRSASVAAHRTGREKVVARTTARSLLGAGTETEAVSRPAVAAQNLVAADLDDDALMAAIPGACMADAVALAGEAARRGLVAAAPALERLCRRFAGFGLERAVPEQVATLEALGRIGGANAAQVVARLIIKGTVQGPTMKVAARVAARLKAPMPAATILALLKHPDPDVRADACRCAGSSSVVVHALLALADDDDDQVRVAALCALGRLGRHEAHAPLARVLREAPSLAVIDAIPNIADEDCVILLGRIVRRRPALADAALEALELIDHPRARHLVAALAAERAHLAEQPTPDGDAARR
jgi:HEAT repeat protein